MAVASQTSWVHALPSSQLEPPTTVVVAVAELFPGTRSTVGLEMLAMLLIEPPAQLATRTASTKLALPSKQPLTFETHLIAPVPPVAGAVQLHPDGVERLRKEVPGGVLVCITAIVAGFGPAFVAVMVYVTVPFAAAGSGLSESVIPRLAAGG